MDVITASVIEFTELANNTFANLLTLPNTLPKHKTIIMIKCKLVQMLQKAGIYDPQIGIYNICIIN